MRRTLYKVLIDKYPHKINDADYDLIKKEVSFFLLEGFTVDECVDAALLFYDRHPIYDDDPAACFSYGMNQLLIH